MGPWLPLEQADPTPLVSALLPLSHVSPPQDRLILGSNSAYLYIGFPSERGSEDLSRFDYDFFQLERAAAEGVSVDKLGEQPLALLSSIFRALIGKQLLLLCTLLPPLRK